MAKFRVTFHPNCEKWDYEGEADNVEEFLEDAQDFANMNCYFEAEEVEEFKENENN